MKSTQALRILAELTPYQGGMVTSAQAALRGITRLDLSRLAEGGHLVRLAHGVYLDAGAPGDGFDDLRAAWLSTEPKVLGEVRIKDLANGVVIAGESATRLHRIGDFRAVQHDFVSPIRRQSQRPEIRYRRRDLDPRDVTLVEGLPVMTIERTIADLVEDLKDLSLAADTLRDASGKRILDYDRLWDLLAPLAERNGFGKRDGHALLTHLMEISGVDIDSIARRVAADPALGPRVFAESVARMSKAEIDQFLVSLQGALDQQLTESTSKRIAEYLLSNEMMRELIRSRTESLSDSLTVKPETVALARSAVRAAASD
jgi:hypothetical protein